MTLVSEEFQCTSLADKLARFTEVPCGPAQPPELVVVVPPGAELAAGFALSRRLLDQHKSAVRIVGSGVTLRRIWPEWIHSASGFSLTELGAYVRETQAEATTNLRNAIRSWLDDTFLLALPGFSPNRTFYSAAALRCFQPLLDAYPQAMGLMQVHPSATFVCAGEWSGHRILEALRPRSVQRRLIARARDAILFAVGRPRILFLGAVAIAGAVAVVTRDYLASGASRRRIRELCSERQRLPRTWIAVVADWPRMNWHALDSVAQPELHEYGTIGILLINSLASGERSEQTLASKGAALWPGLAPIADEIENCVVDQAVAPQNLKEFLNAVRVGVCGAAATLARIGTRRVMKIDDDAEIDLGRNSNGLARLATIDIMRGAVAAEAARGLIERHDFRGAHVVFAAAGPTQVATVDLVLQRVGATTYHFAHGCHFNDPVGGGEHSAAIQCAWTYADAQSRAALKETVIVAGMPERLRRHRPGANGDKSHVLILSGYAHRDDGTRGRLEVFQDELLDVIRRIGGTRCTHLAFRWRPHPADQRESVERTRRRLGLEWLDVSWRNPLERDVQWADIVVSSLSTVVSECLAAGLPVFVHHLPQVWGLPATTFLDPARTFVHAEDGASKIRNYLTRPDDTPERRARTALWGPSGRPASLLKYIHPTERGCDPRPHEFIGRRH